MSGLWQTMQDIFQNKPVLSGLLILGAGFVLSGAYCRIDMAWNYRVKRLNARNEQLQKSQEEFRSLSREEYSDACLDDYLNY